MKNTIGLLLALAAGSTGLFTAAKGQDVRQAPVAATAPAMPAGVTVTPVAIEEVRRASLSPLAPKWPVIPELKLTLYVTGDTAVKVSRFGRLKIDEAVDDAGQSLIKPEAMAAKRPKEGLETIDEWKRRGVANGFALELRFQPASRKAGKIARLNGSFVMMTGGKPTEVTVKNAAALTGKEAEDAALAAAGVKVKIDAGTQAGRQIAYVLEGNEDVVVKAELVDDSGKPIRAIEGASQMGDGPAIHTLGAQAGKMPDTAGLKLTLLDGAKILPVPLALKDIPLP